MVHGCKEFLGPDDHTYHIKELITCSTRYVFYGWPHLPGNYVGRTIRLLRERFREHWLAVEKRLLQYSVSKHYATHQAKDASLLEVFGIQSIPLQIPEGKRFEAVFQRNLLDL